MPHSSDGTAPQLFSWESSVASRYLLMYMGSTAVEEGVCRLPGCGFANLAALAQLLPSVRPLRPWCARHVHSTRGGRGALLQRGDFKASLISTKQIDPRLIRILEEQVRGDGSDLPFCFLL